MTLGYLDTTLLVISLVASAAIGLYHGIRGLKQTSDDYLLGSRRLRPLPLAMSLSVGTVSAITIMGNAGEMYTNGTQLWIMDVGMSLGMYFVSKSFIPIFHPLKMVSLYHYIESRFHSKWLRRATVVLTLCGAYLFMGFLLFPPSFFLESFTGLSMATNVVITGLACALYSSFGGVRAVVYSDVFQSLVMLSGTLAIIIQGSMNVGGLDEVWRIAYNNKRIEFFNFSLDPYQRHSFWLVLVYGFFFSLSTYGVNQSQTQRTFSTATVKEAQRVIHYAIVGTMLFKGLANLSGIVIFANYVECDPLTLGGGKPKTNLFISVQYVLQNLTKIPGLAGLFVASIYAAVLSSMSTQVNSVTALVWEDFLKGLTIFSNWSEVKVARLQKVLGFATGIVGIAMSLFAAKFGSFLRALLQITGAVWGPMVGVFICAIYLPWVKAKGAAIGFLFATVISIWIVVGQIITQKPPLYLPMSHKGCLSSVNSTNSTGININNITTSLRNEDDEIESLNRGEGFYGISYCLNYCWGVISCVIIAALVTALTTSNTPEEVDQKLISPVSWQCFTKGIKTVVIKQLRGGDKTQNKKDNAQAVDKYQEEKEPLDNLQYDEKHEKIAPELTTL